MNNRLSELVTSFLAGDINENDASLLLEQIRQGGISAEQLAAWSEVCVSADLFFLRKKTRQKSFRRRYVRIASFAAIAAIGLVLLVPNEKTYYAGASKTYSVELSDGTRICLNSGSVLKVPRNFSSDNRNVTLEGEATFNVVKSQSPMRVKTGDFGEIMVYGTEFNARSYPSDSKVEISLKNGSVSYKPEASLRPFTIEAGEKIVFDRLANSVDIDNVDVDASFLWKKGETIFTDDCFRDIISAVERMYNINISYSLTDLSLLGRRQSLTIYDSESLETVLNKISLSAGARYEISSDRKSVTVFNL